MRYDRGYHETRVLANGRVVRLRFIRPEDRDALVRAFGKLSRESRYRRFLVDVPFMSPAMARYLTEVDGKDHVAIVAMTDSLDLKEEEGVGVARFFRLPEEPHVAEAAVTVIDVYQGQGLGRILLEALTRAARERGIRIFRSAVLVSNAPMRRILDEAGGVVHRDEGDTLVIDVPIGDPEPHWSDLAIFRVLRVAAEATRSAFFGEADDQRAEDESPAR
ncbi:bifunctional class I SAM-dependent methyltransferase/GNAT family N-acetyltransferase [Polyangium sp. y55x31]|uniref:GNAT family N-acetyltransferase n=1 Tax=Polyangium sp. y55x31 TaxID=3042688 RepID=UPI00248285C1|nr:bifunctional class I SAM-dependent methyltransferase/GNAT family N-acetyltransferase [Polyangium sp. y55x31]MDI1478274.1 bifunctional class I SAM-dependent methyltransferase/GNAT family N-acetyltransferase [Polyangium sp. y55x31]